MTEQTSDAGNEPPAAVHGIREQAQPASPLLLILTGVFAIVVAALLTYYSRTADLTEWQGWAKDALTVLQGLLLAGGVLTVLAALWSTRPRRGAGS